MNCLLLSLSVGYYSSKVLAWSSFSLSEFQVKVVDRTAVVTANAETVVVQPAGIQEAIDTETGKN